MEKIVENEILTFSHFWKIPKKQRLEIGWTWSWLLQYWFAYISKWFVRKEKHMISLKGSRLMRYDTDIPGPAK